MAYYRAEEKAKLRRQRTKEAIALAMQNRWEEAVAANRTIIEIFSTDVDAYNRLGKALTELGEYAEAREAYARALEIDPGNSIAKKNLSRLSHLKEAPPSPKDGHKVDPRTFIEETGRTSLTNIYHLAPREVLARVAAGDQVYLKINGQSLQVVDASGEYIGEIEPKLALRLIKLMNGGNRYAAAIASLGEHEGKVIIREVYQHPSQRGLPSFPSKAADGFRPYIKESLLKYELEDEEKHLEGYYPAEWEEGIEPLPEEVALFRNELASEANADEEDLEE